MAFYKWIHTYVCREVRECLRLDPEHKDCFPHYKIVKKIDKLISDAQEDINSKDYQDCIDNANKVRVMCVSVSDFCKLVEVASGRTSYLCKLVLMIKSSYTEYIWYLCVDCAHCFPAEFAGDS